MIGNDISDINDILGS
jgi:hypothetical protein